MRNGGEVMGSSAASWEGRVLAPEMCLSIWTPLVTTHRKTQVQALCSTGRVSYPF